MRASFFAPIVLACLCGCYSDENVTLLSLPAADGELRIDTHRTHDPLLAWSLGRGWVSTESLVYVGADGSERVIPLHRNGYLAAITAESASIVRDRGYTNQLRPRDAESAGEIGGDDRDAYLAPDQFSQEELEAIAAAIRDNLDAVDDAFSTKKDGDGNVVILEDGPRIMSVRHFDPDSVSTHFVHQQDRNVAIDIYPKGYIYLQLPIQPTGQKYRGVDIGRVVEDGKTLLMADPTELQEVDGFDYMKLRYNPMNSLGKPEFYEQCKDESGRSLADTFDEIRVVPARHLKDHFWADKLQSYGGTERLIAELEIDPMNKAVAMEISQGGTAMKSARPALLKSYQAGNSNAPLALAKIAGDEEDKQLVELLWDRASSEIPADAPKDRRIFQSQVISALHEIAPTSPMLPPLVWERLRTNTADAKIVSTCVRLLCTATPESKELREHLLVMLKHEDPAIRRVACLRLSDEPFEKYAVPELKKLSEDDPDQQVRREARRSLDAIEYRNNYPR